MRAMVLLCMAGMAGIGATALPGSEFGLLLLGMVLAAWRWVRRPTLIRRWAPELAPWFWVLLGVVALLMAIYTQIRTPYPAADDLSRTIAPGERLDRQQLVMVRGRLLGEVRQTTAGKGRFLLEAVQTGQILSSDAVAIAGDDREMEPTQAVSGRAYVTVPLLQATGLQPGDWVRITGELYRPSEPKNPGAFDFRRYLARQGCFSLLAGQQVEVLGDRTGESANLQRYLASLRRRIVQGHVGALGYPQGAIAAGMVLGNRAVDLPAAVREQFAAVGLAHVLAASGFHVSIVLVVVLFAARGLSRGGQVACGLVALVGFAFLAGGSPSVLRAVVMGTALLTAFGAGERVRSAGSLTAAATLLLLWNPLWLWDLGFQLSFLATLGLIVSGPALEERLRAIPGVPDPLAGAIAIPLAATLWTLPLQMYVFFQVPSYSLVVNVLTGWLLQLVTGLIFLASLGWLTIAPVGQFFAAIARYPLELLLHGVEFFAQLPGGMITTGAISLGQVVLLYGLFIWVWRGSWWHRPRRWILAGAAAIAVLWLPLWHGGALAAEALTLDTGNGTTLLIRDRGQTTLIYGNGNADTTQFDLLPLLRQRGIDRLDGAIALGGPGTDVAPWQALLDRVDVPTIALTSALDRVTPPLRSLLATLAVRGGQVATIDLEQPVTVGAVAVQSLDGNRQALLITKGDRRWLLFDNLSVERQRALVAAQAIPPVAALWWNGRPLAPQLLDAARPTVAIATARQLDPDTLLGLRQRNIQVFWTGRDGAIAWSPQAGFGPATDETRESAAWF